MQNNISFPQNLNFSRCLFQIATAAIKSKLSSSFLVVVTLDEYEEVNIIFILILDDILKSLADVIPWYNVTRRIRNLF